MGEVTFVYHVELLAEQNPPGTYDRLREDIRAFFSSHSLAYAMGALGGGHHCYGQVMAPDGQSAEDAKRSLTEVIRRLHFRGVVRIGPVASAEPPPDLLQLVTGTVIEVDNLTEGEKAEAAAHFAELRRSIE